MEFRTFTAVIAAMLVMGCSAPVQPPVAPVRDHYYDHEGVTIRFRDTGRGRPVIFVHGFGTSLDTWRHITEDLTAEYRVITLDLKGHGFSGRPRDDKYFLSDHAEVVLGLARYLGLEEVTIVGHSFGAVVSVAAALQAIEGAGPRISGLAVIGGALEPEHVPFYLKLLRVPLLGWLSVKLTTASFRTRVMLLRAYFDDSKVTDELVKLYAAYQTIPDTEQAMIATAGRIIPENLPLLRRKLAAFRIPVLNVWGEHDIVVKRPGAESVCKILSRCKFVVIAGAGHVPQEETPREIVTLLREFLAQLTITPAA